MAIRLLVRMLSASGLLILMYHSVSANSRDPHAVHPEVFEKQMLRLARKPGGVIKLSDAITNHHRLDLIARKTVLTFDDGSIDFLTNAAPVLQSYGLLATVFVPTGLIGRNATPDRSDPSKRLMDWEDLIEVHEGGFEIWSHIVSHRLLMQCDPSDLELELRESLAKLRERIAEVVPVLSYPGGNFDVRRMTSARLAGDSAAVGVSSRMSHSREQIDPILSEPMPHPRSSWNTNEGLSSDTVSCSEWARGSIPRILNAPGFRANCI